MEYEFTELLEESVNQERKLTKVANEQKLVELSKLQVDILAKQLTLIDSGMFQAIELHEFFGQAWAKGR